MRLLTSLKSRASRVKQLKQQWALSGAIRSVPTETSFGYGSRERFRVAVVGAGPQGRDQCLGLKTLPNVLIAGIADRNAETLETLRAGLDLPGLHCYTDAAELLRAEKIDLLCVA